MSTYPNPTGKTQFLGPAAYGLMHSHQIWHDNPSRDGELLQESSKGKIGDAHTIDRQIKFCTII